ncbi:MAG: DUF2752 domain-containing protein [Bacteroidales bacterium]|nr:DUF2752 domain-containing protein [Bacteroidales bacterium]
MNKIKEYFKALFFVNNNSMPLSSRYYSILTIIIIGIIYFSLAELPSQNKDGHFTICIIKNLTSYPCPCCGTVRGLKYFFHFHFKEAFMMNPISWLTAIFMFLSFIWICYDLITKKTTYNDFFNKKIHWSLIVLIVIFLVINEIWNIQKNI